MTLLFTEKWGVCGQDMIIIEQRVFAAQKNKNISNVFHYYLFFKSFANKIFAFIKKLWANPKRSMHEVVFQKVLYSAVMVRKVSNNFNLFSTPTHK